MNYFLSYFLCGYEVGFVFAFVSVWLQNGVCAGGNGAV